MQLRGDDACDHPRGDRAVVGAIIGFHHCSSAPKTPTETMGPVRNMPPDLAVSGAGGIAARRGLRDNGASIAPLVLARGVGAHEERLIMVGTLPRLRTSSKRSSSYVVIGMSGCDTL